MKIRAIIPITQPANDPAISPESITAELIQFKSPDTEIDVVFLPNGPTSIECYTDEVLAAANLLDLVVQAEKEKFDGVYINCFGDPGVRSARELVKIPVVGAFHPSILVASLLGNKCAIVTVLKSTIPMLYDLAKIYAVESKIVSIRDINTPVLELNHVDIRKLLLDEIEKAIDVDGAEVIILGCTGMMGLSQFLNLEISRRNKIAPIVDPSGAAIGYLELLIRNQLSQSPVAYIQAVRTICQTPSKYC